MDERKNAAVTAGQTACDNGKAPVAVASDAIIQRVQPSPQAQNQENAAGVKQSKQSKKSEQRALTINHSVYTLAIKCYGEQLPSGWDSVKDAICATDKRDFQVIAIQHYKDLYSEDGSIWKSAFEKPHYHIIVRCTDRKKRVRVSTVLKGLGIVFRPGIDDALWTEHGVETVRNFAGYATYLTHETEDAIRDGKELYSVDELVSNLSCEEIMQIREGYIRVSENRKVGMDELVALDKEAYDLGYSLGSFSDWYGRQPFAVRSNARMKTVRESYERGLTARIEERTEMTRLCVFIQGEPNTGKTYAANAALAGKKILSVGGSGSGKFDNLRPDHDAIIVDDDACPNLLNMADNYICRAYRRNRDNPVWAGRYFIVTSNLRFADWAEKCGIPFSDRQGCISDTYLALESRFYICDVSPSNGNHLVLTRPASRGSFKVRLERQDMFAEFFKAFNSTMSQYQPHADDDWDEMMLTADMVEFTREYMPQDVEAAYEKFLAEQYEPPEPPAPAASTSSVPRFNPNAPRQGQGIRYPLQ